MGPPPRLAVLCLEDLQEELAASRRSFTAAVAEVEEVKSANSKMEARLCYLETSKQVGDLRRSSAVDSCTFVQAAVAEPVHENPAPVTTPAPAPITRPAPAPEPRRSTRSAASRGSASLCSGPPAPPAPAAPPLTRLRKKSGSEAVAPPANKRARPAGLLYSSPSLLSSPFPLPDGSSSAKQSEEAAAGSSETPETSPSDSAVLASGSRNSPAQ